MTDDTGDLAKERFSWKGKETGDEAYGGAETTGFGGEAGGKEGGEETKTTGFGGKVRNAYGQAKEAHQEKKDARVAEEERQKEDEARKRAEEERRQRFTEEHGYDPEEDENLDDESDPHHASHYEDTGEEEGRVPDVAPEQVNETEETPDPREGPLHNKFRAIALEEQGKANAEAMRQEDNSYAENVATPEESAAEQERRRVEQEEKADREASQKRAEKNNTTWAEEQEGASAEEQDAPEEEEQDSLYEDPKAQDIFRRHAEKFLKAAGETAVENWGEGVSKGWDMAQNLVRMTLTHPSAMSSSSRMIGTALTGLQTASDFQDRAAARYGMKVDADPALVKDTLRYKLYLRDKQAGDNVAGNTFRTISESLARNGGDMQDMSPSQLSAHMQDMMAEKDRLLAALNEKDLKPSDRRLLTAQAQHLQTYVNGITKQARSLQAQQGETNRYLRAQDLDRRRRAYSTLSSGQANPYADVLRRMSPTYRVEVDPATGMPADRNGLNSAVKTIDIMIDEATAGGAAPEEIERLKGLRNAIGNRIDRMRIEGNRARVAQYGPYAQRLVERHPIFAEKMGEKMKDVWEKGVWTTNSISLDSLRNTLGVMMHSSDPMERAAGHMLLISLDRYKDKSGITGVVSKMGDIDIRNAIDTHKRRLAYLLDQQRKLSNVPDGPGVSEYKQMLTAQIELTNGYLKSLENYSVNRPNDRIALDDAYQRLHEALMATGGDDEALKSPEYKDAERDYLRAYYDFGRKYGLFAMPDITPPVPPGEGGGANVPPGGGANVPPGGGANVPPDDEQDDQYKQDDQQDDQKRGDEQNVPPGGANVPPGGANVPPTNKQRFESRPNKAKTNLNNYYKELGIDGAALTDADDDILLKNTILARALPKTPQSIKNRMQALLNVAENNWGDLSPTMKRIILSRYMTLRSRVPAEKKGDDTGGKGFDQTEAVKGLFNDDGNVNEDFFKDADKAKAELLNRGLIGFNTNGKLGLNKKNFGMLDGNAQLKIQPYINGLLNKKSSPKPPGGEKKGDEKVDDRKMEPDLTQLDNTGGAQNTGALYRRLGMAGGIKASEVQSKVEEALNTLKGRDATMNDYANAAQNAVIDLFKDIPMNDTQRKNLAVLAGTIGSNAFIELSNLRNGVFDWKPGESDEVKIGTLRGLLGKGYTSEQLMARLKKVDSDFFKRIRTDPDMEGIRSELGFDTDENHDDGKGKETDPPDDEQQDGNGYLFENIDEYKKATDKKAWVDAFLKHCEEIDPADKKSAISARKILNNLFQEKDLSDYQNRFTEMNRRLQGGQNDRKKKEDRQTPLGGEKTEEQKTSAHLDAAERLIRDWNAGENDRKSGKVGTYESLKDFAKGVSGELRGLLSTEGADESRVRAAMSMLTRIFSADNGFADNYNTILKNLDLLKEGEAEYSPEEVQKMLDDAMAIENSYNEIRNTVIASDDKRFQSWFPEFRSLVQGPIGRREDYTSDEDARSRMEREKKEKENDEKIRNTTYNEIWDSLKGFRNAPARLRDNYGFLLRKLQMEDPTESENMKLGSKAIAANVRAMMFTGKGNLKTQFANLPLDEKKTLDEVMVKHGQQPVFGTIKPQEEQKQGEQKKNVPPTRHSDEELMKKMIESGIVRENRFNRWELNETLLSKMAEENGMSISDLLNIFHRMKPTDEEKEEQKEDWNSYSDEKALERLKELKVISENGSLDRNELYKIAGNDMKLTRRLLNIYNGSIEPTDEQKQKLTLIRDAEERGNWYHKKGLEFERGAFLDDEDTRDALNAIRNYFSELKQYEGQDFMKNTEKQYTFFRNSLADRLGVSPEEVERMAMGGSE